MKPKATPVAAKIEWEEWGPAAFQRARVRDWPILLNVVVSWSRQCRDMEATWSDRTIAALVSDHFVPVRVDADRRPDIRERYLTGGWPSVTLLRPDGNPIFYAAKEGKAEPVRVRFSFLPPDKVRPILEETLDYYRSRKGTLRKAVNDGLKAEAEPTVDQGQIDRGALPKVLETLKANFDALYGGWTKAPKFPMSGPIQALLFSYAHDSDPADLEIAERALKAVVQGPLFDRVEGGVHRIALEADWSRPEYEKLLDRNVAVLEDLLSAYLITSNSLYAERASQTIGYLEGPLKRPGGGHYASQAADPASSDGGEYYRATAADRAKKAAPPVDRLVSVGWSAKAAAAELRAACLLDRRSLVPPARETLDWLLGAAYTRGRGVVHAIELDEKSGKEAALLPAYLEDQVLFAEAMLDAYQLTGDKRYYRAAVDIARFALANLRDPKTALFGDTIPGPGAPVPFRAALHPFELNCRMARVLAHLFYLDAEQRTFRDGASGVLSALAPRYERMGPAAALYALAAAEYHEGPMWVWVLGGPSVPDYPTFLTQANRLPAVWKMVVTLDPVDDGETILRHGFTQIPAPAVYLTSGAHTSKGAQFPTEVNETYKALIAFLAEEKKRSGGTGGSDKP